MAIWKDLKAAVSAARRHARALARELNRALAEPERLEAGDVKRARDESVFQPRKH